MCTIPRASFCPYMIDTVSTNTFNALEPDHSDRMKPTEMTSTRPSRSTSSIVGRSSSLMLDSVRKREAYTWIAETMLLIVSGPIQPPTKPSPPKSPRTSGGRLSSMKKAPSAASPVTR